MREELLDRECPRSGAVLLLRDEMSQRDLRSSRLRVSRLAGNLDVILMLVGGLKQRTDIGFYSRNISLPTCQGM